MNLGNNQSITFIEDNTFNQKAWTCEECLQKFKEQKYLDSRKGFKIVYPYKRIFLIKKQFKINNLYYLVYHFNDSCSHLK